MEHSFLILCMKFIEVGVFRNANCIQSLFAIEVFMYIFVLKTFLSVYLVHDLPVVKLLCKHLMKMWLFSNTIVD